MARINSNRSQVILALFVIVMVSAFAFIFFWEPDDGLVQYSTGTIGVIEVYGVLDDGFHANLLSSAIQEAIDDNRIKAVVLDINSPGGSAHLTEQVYLDVLELREKKPVVASCTMALSGGYYIAASAEQIFALPSGMVGNVGVIGTGPGWVIPGEMTLETGPHKITGFSPELFPFTLTGALDGFKSAVLDSRGDRLKISIDEVGRGSIWMGSEAVNIGIIDGVGSTQFAIKEAASLVDLEEWDVEYLVGRLANETLSVEVNYPSVEELNVKNPPPSIYYLYMPGDVYMESEDPDTINITASDDGFVGDVVVDMSHENVVSPWLLDGLAEALVDVGLYVGYSANWSHIEKNLNETKALIVATPRKFYSHSEFLAVDAWVKDGGVLIFLGDASGSFLDSNVLQGALNSLSDHWSLHFTNGYLYDMVDNHGLYRNIIVDDIRDSVLSEDVDEVVFFTSGAIESRGSGVMKTSLNVYNSVSERPSMHSVVAVYDLNNSTVIAFGDMTWLVKPYLNTADNGVLLENLVDVIASGN